MERVTSVPKVTCESVCFSNTILDHPMNGERMNRRKRYGLVGKRYMSVAKSSVEYVMCPDIFQKNVMNVITEDTRNMFKDIFVKI